MELLGRYSWYLATSEDHTWPCGSLLPNDLGLFDMLGNMYEWCHDRPLPFRPDQAGPIIDDINTQEDTITYRVLRGGAFYLQPADIRSALRDWNAQTNRGSDNGFRLARTYD